MKKNIDWQKESSIIIESIKANHFKMRDHAGRRSDERLLTRQNVINVVNSLILTKYQQDKCTHWFMGFLDEKQTGGFTAVMDEGVWIVTLFKRRLTPRERKLL